MSNYLYGLPLTNNDVFTVDGGCDQIINLDYNNDTNELNTYTRKTIPKQNERQFTVYNPVLPLDQCNCFMPTSTRDLITSKFHLHNDVQITSNMQSQYKDFMINHGKYFAKTKKSCVSKASLERFDVLCKKASQFENIRYRKYLQRNNVTEKCSVIQTLNALLTDIPSNILQEYLDESLFAQYDDLVDNYAHCNTIASFTYESNVYILCPYGPCLSELVIKQLVTKEVCSCGGKPNILLESNIIEKHEFGFRIKEVTLVLDYLFFIRGDYQCAVFAVDLSTESSHLTVKYKWKFDDLIHCACVNPYNLQELIVATNKRAITVVQDSFNQRLVADNSFAEHVKWQRCLYGTSLNTCIVSTENDISLYDFRAPTTQSTHYLELPCQYLNRVEKLTPVLQWSPWNTYQYTVTSDQSIIVNDERYAKTPVLKVNHYLEDSPRYLQSLDLKSNNTLVTLGSYKDGELICVQLCQQSDKDVQLTVKEPPWKLSSFHDWTTSFTDWRLSLFDVKKRLKQPLSGYTLFNLPSMEKDEETFCGMISQSIPGDLFYQLFSCRQSERQNNRLLQNYVSVRTPSCFNQKTSQMNPIHFEKCKNWIQQALYYEHMFSEQTNIGAVNTKLKSKNDVQKTIPNSQNTENTKRETDNSSNHQNSSVSYSETLTKSFLPLSFAELKEEILSNSELMVEKEMNDLDTTGVVKTEEEVEKKDEMNATITALRTTNTILTNKSLKRSISTKSLDLFKENPSVFKGPITKVLDSNWNSEKYTFLDNFAPNVAFDPSFNTN